MSKTEDTASVKFSIIQQIYSGQIDVKVVLQTRT